LRLFAGVHAVIEEPILNAGWWSLPVPIEEGCNPAAACAQQSWVNAEDSVLGFTSMLAPAEPQGAVVGTTAALDRSHLITGDEFGATLFQDRAGFSCSMTARTRGSVSGHLSSPR
jgi:hypothetical protein